MLRSNPVFLRDRVAAECPAQEPCEASVLANVFCELSTVRSEDGVARRPRGGHLRQDPSCIGRHFSA